MTYKVIHTVLDFLFPAKCIGCSRGTVPICDSCDDKISYKGEECFFCLSSPKSGNICDSCKAESHIESFVWPWKYNNKIARKIISRFKYGKKSSLSEHLSQRLDRALNNNSIPKDVLIIPVPLHPNKEKERGFNQAELIAENIGGEFMKNLVIRVKDTPPLARTASKQERKNQLRDAFRLTRPELIFGKQFLIIDDVATSGTTVSEIAGLLHSAGADKIYVAVLAHG